MDLDRHKPRWISRRGLLGAAAAGALAFFPRWPAAAGQTSVVVLFVSGVEAYAEAVNGLKEGLARLLPNPVFVDVKTSRNEAALAEALRKGPDRVVITVGTEALTAAAAAKVEAILMPTMILQSDWPANPQSTHRGAAVHLDVPLAGIVNELRGLFPGKNRFGILHNPLRGDSDPSHAMKSKQPGLTFHTADCSRPEDLVKAFLSLKGKTDFVILFPDSALYNSTTLKPLILASLESRLPVVGFSASFVRAGAAVGVYPDFRDIGAQTADLAQRFLAGKTALSDESPRKLQVSVNQRVLRLLGLDCKQQPGLVVYR